MSEYPRVIPVADTSIVLDKRTHFPCIVEDTCPKCGKAERLDFSSGVHYLSYPAVNDRTYVSMYHSDANDGGGCDHEWRVSVIVRCTLEIVKP